MSGNISFKVDKVPLKGVRSQTLPEVDRTNILGDLFAQCAENLAPEERKLLLEILPSGQSVNLKITAVKEYPDSREGSESHKATDFTVRIEREQGAAFLLKELLGEENASSLMKDFYGKVDFTRKVPVFNKVILLTESNFSNSIPSSRDGSDHQRDDLLAAGLKFADTLKALIVCSALVKKAKDAGVDLDSMIVGNKENQSEALSKLNPFEVDLLSKLTEGWVRIGEGRALNIRSGGSLSGNNHISQGSSNVWTLGEVNYAD